VVKSVTFAEGTKSPAADDTTSPAKLAQGTAAVPARK